jgi:multiple antibiotic resistance protein
VEGLAREMLLLGTSLLTLFNPPSAVVSFATLARPYPREVQTRMARRTAIFYCLAVLVVIWAGRPLLSMLGLSLPALRVAGGFVLLISAVPMVSHYRRSDAQEETALESPSAAGETNWVQVVAVPLTFPISIGGATVAALIAFTNEHPSLRHAVGTTVVGLLMTGVVWLSLASAVPLTRRISRGSMAALTAFSGLLLLCIAFQVMAAGVRDLLPGLSHPAVSSGRTPAGSA